MLKWGLVTLAMVLSGSASAASPYYLDCRGTSEYRDVDNHKQTMQVHWALFVDESKNEVRDRHGLNGPFVSSCNKGCDGVKISENFIEWTVKVTVAELPNYESHTQTQINRKTWRLSDTSWEGDDPNGDVATGTSSTQCKRSSRPPA